MLNKKALAASVSAPPAIYPEDVFSTYLYTGNSSTQTINNGIDLAGEGGLVWIKNRNNTSSNTLYDTERGNTKSLYSNTTNGESTVSAGLDLSGFNSNGFSLGPDGIYTVNYDTYTYASWTFRKQPKFFDVVTYTGNGASGRNVAHSLGSKPGMILIKSTSGSQNWAVWHRNNGVSAATFFSLNLTDAAEVDAGYSAFCSSTTFSVSDIGPPTGSVNTNGQTYVAYLFAHDAGGFGTAGTDNVISCGSYTGNGSGTGPVITLGYEPQWILIKRTNSTSNWTLIDNMRGIPTGSDTARLFPNLSDAEVTDQETANLLATGFQIATADAPVNASGGTYIYMAIRRPMKVPTTGTEVFSPIISSASLNTKLTTGFPVDSQWAALRTGDSDNVTIVDRLRLTSTNATESGGLILETSNNGVEQTGASQRALFWDNTGFRMPGWYEGGSMIFWNFRRAAGFFDQVCYPGTGTAKTVAHNLTVVPELMIVKRRSGLEGWAVYYGDNTDYLRLNETQGTVDDIGRWNDTSPTSTVFTVGADDEVNRSANTYIAYLFATVAGVSKVGSYTGTGTTQTINCGFSSGARFVMIKRKDDSGDWYIWDTARGIVSGNDPYLLVNSSAAEVTSTDYIDPSSSGFEISSTAPAAINANGGSFIFLAIA